MSEATGHLVELELWQLEQPYADLRIRAKRRVAQLCASLLEDGQTSPLLVVAGVEADRYVLIDGHERVRALRRAGYDSARVLVLPLTAHEALAWSYRLSASTRRTPLEEGWLVRELCDAGARKHVEIAELLQRSASWVSRRLGLVEELPESVQALVRSGALSAHAAMKSLVPLARANARGAEQLAEVAAREQLSSRQIDKLCRAWRAASPEQRDQLVRESLLYLKVEERIAQGSRSDDDRPALVRDFELLAAVARRSERLLRHGDESCGVGEALTVVWPRTEHALAQLDTAIKEAMDAGLGYPPGGPPTCG